MGPSCQQASAAVPRVPAMCMRLVLAFIILISHSIADSSALIAQTKTATEYQVKAAFLYNFAKFVEWPPSAFSDAKQPLDICVYGRDPFGSALEDALLGKTIGERRVGLGGPRNSRACGLPGGFRVGAPARRSAARFGQSAKRPCDSTRW